MEGAHPSRRDDASSYYLSPLRYPGGKRRLANFMKLAVRMNNVLDGDYAEVYAGGASIALALLYGDYVRRIHINDLDPGIFAFWSAARNNTDQLAARVQSVQLTMDEWRRQRAVQTAGEPDPLDLAVSTFFLNRTNRSGIVGGGPIGGVAQEGSWRIDARFNRADLLRRIERIGRHRSRITVSCLDGATFLGTVASQLPTRSLVYLDPPYYVKGQQRLYANYYGAAEHAAIADHVASLRTPWVVSYDNAAEIAALYEGFHFLAYGISYSAGHRYVGNEIMFFSRDFVVPPVSSPPTVSANILSRLERELRQEVGHPGRRGPVRHGSRVLARG
jgi:DNA adenine methylase